MIRYFRKRSDRMNPLVGCQTLTKERNMKVSEYRIIEGTIMEVEMEVKMSLSNGWEIHGQPYTSGKHNHKHCQAIVKQ